MDAKTLSLCAARALIREQEALHSLHTSGSSGSSGDGAALAEAYKQRALALSLSTGLLCKWSSYVAVELRRGDPADSGEQQPARTTHIYSSRDAPFSRSYGGWAGASFGATHNPVYMMAPAPAFGAGPGSWSAAPAASVFRVFAEAASGSAWSGSALVSRLTISLMRLPHLIPFTRTAKLSAPIARSVSLQSPACMLPMPSLTCGAGQSQLSCSSPIACLLAQQICVPRLTLKSMVNLPTFPACASGAVMPLSTCLATSNQASDLAQ